MITRSYIYNNATKLLQTPCVMDHTKSPYNFKRNPVFFRPPFLSRSSVPVAPMHLFSAVHATVAHVIRDYLLVLHRAVQLTHHCTEYVTTVFFKIEALIWSKTSNVKYSAHKWKWKLIWNGINGLGPTRNSGQYLSW